LTQNLKIDFNCNNLNYFLRLEHFIMKFSKEIQCQVLSSDVYYHLSRINFDDKKYDEALISAEKSYINNPKNRASVTILHKIVMIEMNFLQNIKEKELLLELFNETNNEIVINFTQIKENLKFFSFQNIPSNENCQYLIKLEDIYSHLTAIWQIQNLSDLPKLKSNISQIIKIMNPLENLTEFLNKLLELGVKITKLDKKLNFTENLRNWLQIFKEIQLNISQCLYQKLKALKPNEYMDSDENLMLIISLTAINQQIILDNKMTVIINQDLELIKIRSEAYNLLGNSFFSKANYDNSSICFLKAINDNSQNENPFEKLAKIYFITGETYINKIDERTLNKIVNFNKIELTRIFNEYFVNILRNFQSNHSFFKFNKEKNEYLDLIYLETLKKVLDFIEKMHKEEDLTSLIEIQVIWNEFINVEILRKTLEESKPIICEKYFIDQNENMKSPLKNDLILNQFLYIQKLVGIQSGKKLIKDFFFTSKNEKNYIGTLEENMEFFMKKLEDFSLMKGWKEISYYQRVRELFFIWGKKSLFCAKTLSQTFFYLGSITTDEIAYDSALSYDKDFYTFCSNQAKLPYYHENTMRREICNSLGMICLKKEIYNLAWNFFKISQNHLKLKVVFQKMLEKEPENIDLLVGIGDYYADIGMSEAANAKYREVISLTMDKRVAADMYSRIAIFEEKRKNGGKEQKFIREKGV